MCKLMKLKFEAARLSNGFAPDKDTGGLNRKMKPIGGEWPDYVARLTGFQQNEYMASDDCPAIIFGKFRALNSEGNYSTKSLDDLEYATIFTKDFDKFPIEAFERLDRLLRNGLELLPYKFLIANSFSHLVHKIDDPDPEVRKGPLARFRIFIPPSRPVTPAEFKYISAIQTRMIEERLSNLLGVSIEIDKASNNPVQQYRYHYCKGALYSYESGHDNVFDVDEFLEMHPLPRRKAPVTRKVNGATATTDDVKTVDSRTQFLITEALNRLPSVDLNHDVRFNILCALKRAGMETEAREWCHKDAKDFDAQWKSIHRFDVPVKYIFDTVRKFQ